ncbi:MAG: ArsR/SmtB family transcription factor [Acidimicrobiales bacterium]
MSTHLRRLLEAGLVGVEAQGRHPYNRLADGRVGRAFEALAVLPRSVLFALRPSRVSAELRLVRTCYGRLADAVAVGLADTFAQQTLIVEGHGSYRLELEGRELLRGFGLDLEALERAGRSEGRHHVAGHPCCCIAGPHGRPRLEPQPHQPGGAPSDVGRQGLRTSLGREIPTEPKNRSAPPKTPTVHVRKMNM